VVFQRREKDNGRIRKDVFASASGSAGAAGYCTGVANGMENPREYRDSVD
jgi:hypothetical protein